MDNIKRSVGRAGQNDVEDVALVELALFSVKRANGGTYYPYGQFTGDGRRSEFLEALMAFQLDQGLEPSGTLRPGDATFAALRRKVPDKVRKSDPIRGSSLIPSLSDAVKRAARDVIFDISRKAPLPPLNNRPDIAMELQSILIGTGGRALTPISAIDIEVTNGGFFTAKLSFRKLTSWDNRPHSVLEKAYLIAVNQGLARAEHWTGLSGNRTSTRRAFDALKGIGPADHFRIAPFLQERGISARPTHIVSKACVAALARHASLHKPDPELKDARVSSLSGDEIRTLVWIIGRADNALALQLARLGNDAENCKVLLPKTEASGGIELIFGDTAGELDVELLAFDFRSKSRRGKPLKISLKEKHTTAVLRRESNGELIISNIRIEALLFAGELDMLDGDVEFSLGINPNSTRRIPSLIQFMPNHAFVTLRFTERGMNSCH